MTRAPAPRPCGSCPYRQDVPSGVWHPEEYAKLPLYDLDFARQPAGLFDCHQQDDRLCAGWVGTHDMEENLAVRIAACEHRLTPEEFHAVLDYETPVPLFASGFEAAMHGLADVARPSAQARRVMDRLKSKGLVHE